MLWPLVVITTSKMRTLPIGIAGLKGNNDPSMHLMLAAATVSVIPVLIIFFIFQKKFMDAFSMAGLKG